MTDYTYPSIFFSYFLFFLLAVGAAYFFFRSYVPITSPSATTWPRILASSSPVERG